MTEAAVTLHTLSERDLDVIEKALTMASDSILHHQSLYQFIDQATPLTRMSILRDEMRQLLLKIQAGR